MKDSCSSEEKERFRANLRSFDQNLGPYPYESWKKWISLSNKLTVEIVEKIQPSEKKIGSVADLVPSEVKGEESSEKKRNTRVLRSNPEDALLPPMHARPGTSLNFTSFPESSFPQGSTISEITRYSIDTSHVLRQMLLQWQEPIQLLGELQIAFLCFLIGQVYTAFEHWKKLVNILCSADEHLLENPSLFLEFTGDLYFQMQEIPADFFVDIVSQNNFLTQTLKIFFENILENDGVDQQLKRRCIRLKQYVTQRFHWNFDAEPEDEAPVVLSGDASAENFLVSNVFNINLINNLGFIFLDCQVNMSAL
uniref:Protein AAR2 homolog n=1 Tax=Alona affinis TaxID=381656 RepID=A0A9N6ZEX2_9CRUS|nr:EOG090X0AVR [Alona affinis]